MELKVFIYKESSGELLRELDYSEVISAINYIIDNNIIEEEKLNLICSDVFPPKNMNYDLEKKTFFSFKEINPDIKRQFSNIIKHVI